ncbi:putative sporulation transcription regulator WhiA [Caprobacter fermentans]|uniref:Probable cell division protein WhiA n=1 Tax=Caproicibacter fermentans TaxID=2576756 RepID=A0A6N8I141_9FIRM|nr:DNA-binding protein WhiA [Caproicibacter fermentans]MVB11816.1 putative sporulation transcription regulator WhiA [Caproicibacter fermentans]OCN00766.1 DNA-binding protein WhiA [Clostridium sp. W14A]QNK41702.1 DNA-binding protein WhiA [Caproicibacter fermentans]
MSFSSNTKTELCRIQAADCCRKAECYGLLLFGRCFSAQSITLTTENRETARRAAELTAGITGAFADVSVSPRKGDRKSAYTVSVPGENQIEQVLNQLGHTGREISLRINLANLENDCCRSAFLRGAFLSCGTVTDPSRDYRLEFVVPYRNLARDLTAFLTDIFELDVNPGMLNRKGSYVVYLKGSEHVSDLLTFLGAGNAAMELIQVRMLKEVRNNVNRKTNFEAANIEKTASAAAGQLMALKKIFAGGGVSALPEELRELAILRYRNPDLSLRELGQKLDPPLSRSGVNHRLRRIMELADRLPATEGESHD